MTDKETKSNQAAADDDVHHSINSNNSPPKEKEQKRRSSSSSNSLTGRKRKKTWELRWGLERIPSDDDWYYSSRPNAFDDHSEDFGMPCAERVFLPELYKSGWWIKMPSVDCSAWMLKLCRRLLDTKTKVMVDPQLYSGRIFPSVWLTERGSCWAEKQNFRSSWPRWNCLADLILIFALLEGRIEMLQWLAQMVLLHTTHQARVVWPAFDFQPLAPDHVLESWPYEKFRQVVHGVRPDFQFTIRGLRSQLFAHVPQWLPLIGKGANCLLTVEKLCHALPSDHLFVTTARNWHFDVASSELRIYQKK